MKILSAVIPVPCCVRGITHQFMARQEYRTQPYNVTQVEKQPGWVLMCDLT